MTHKPKINKYLWLSAGKSWRFTTSTRHKLVVLFVFALCILPANLCGQSLAIKSNPDFANLPIVMLSSKDSPFDKARGAMMGCNDYLTKPFSRQSFLEAVRRYLPREE